MSVKDQKAHTNLLSNLDLRRFTASKSHSKLLKYVTVNNI